ncbi:MAG TPA: response regulator transcription factor [Dehalococcoidia bacterium]|nr:response regulator transcription factor [Dehalococcoidia bacterium]
MIQRRILVVDDDRKLVDLIRLYLERDGYRVVPAFDGEMALQLARQTKPALIVLDLMLPRLSGLEVCRRLRGDSDVPIIMLTARSTEDDKLLGLEIGADDYMTKPFSPRELVARIRTVLRRARRGAEAEGPDELIVGPLTISFSRHEVTANGEVIDLTPTEFRLLSALVREPGRAFTRLQLLDKALGTEFEGFERNIDVHVMNIRRKLKLGSNGPIKTVYGVGYKFEKVGTGVA